ncbi:MAG TPA: HEAT repeat domain-containing protein, partial [Polyangiaceae bacterium]|nr:HEAT repeat domain-containing protein [Polyangiaceae bacterium]
MSEVDKIVDLLSNDAVEKRIAAAIVLGEIRAKGALVAEALTGALDSDIPLLQRHALEALARVGAKKAASKILTLLAAREEDVRRAAVEAIVSIGDDVLPTLRARMVDANAEERRSIDAVLAALGGKDAFHVLLGGLASSDAESAKAAAIGVRQRVKDADARQRRSYLAEAEKFLEKQTRQGSGSVGAIAAGVKILGYLEDEKAIPTLIAFTAGPGRNGGGNAPSVRQEALIALRFLLGSDTKKMGAEAKKVIAALVDAAEDSDRALSQTALHTLAGVTIPDDALKRLEKIVLHPDLERARFVMEMLGRQEGPEPAKVLVKVLATTKDKRRAEIAASCLVATAEGVPPPPGSTRHLGDGHGAASPGMAPVRDAAVAPLARALLETEDADRGWLLRSVLKPSAKKVSAATRKEMLELGIKRLAAGDRNWEALVAIARDADPAAAADAMRDIAHRLRKSNPDKALTVLRILCRSEGSNDEDRYALASAEL